MKTTINNLEHEWQFDARWRNVVRHYPASEVFRLRGHDVTVHALSQLTAQKLWHDLHAETPTRALSVTSGMQAVQQVKAGLKSIYVSGWQVAADVNNALQTYPDLSLYPSNSVSYLLKSINNALIRADQIQSVDASAQETPIDYFVPLVADAEAGFGGVLNTFELIKEMIASGVAGIHLEDQLSSSKKCGHMGGKILVSTQHAIDNLIAARLAADVCNSPILIVARTDALSANLLNSDMDARDKPFLTGKRTQDGFYQITGGLQQAIQRCLAFAPYADMLWFETSNPNLQEAKLFSEAIKDKFPHKLLAYNCSPSFNWIKSLSPIEIAHFQERLGELGYVYQFVTLSSFHLINYHTFHFAKEYLKSGMAAYSTLQTQEFSETTVGYSAVKHQHEVGSSYFDEVLKVIMQNQDLLASPDSTENKQF